MDPRSTSFIDLVQKDAVGLIDEFLTKNIKASLLEASQVTDFLLDLRVLLSV